VCDLETSRIGAPYIYDISNLRVNPSALSTSRTVEKFSMKCLKIFSCYMTLDKSFHLKLQRSYIILWHMLLLGTLTICLESFQKLSLHLSYLQEQVTDL